MNRNELKTIAEGFKAARPISPSNSAIASEIEVNMQDAWEHSVKCVANALQLDRQARSLFEAACGLIHSDQG